MAGVWVGHRPGRARRGMGVGAIGAFGSISGNVSSDEIQGSIDIMHRCRRGMAPRDPHTIVVLGVAAVSYERGTPVTLL